MSVQQRFKLLWDMFWSFMKMSPVTFGGGYAMIPLIEREIVENRKWIKAKDMPDMLALAGSSPGAIGVNTSILIGYRVAGLSGAVAAVSGMILPSFIIIITITALLMQVIDHPIVKAALQGIAPAIVAIILYAGYRIGKSSIHNRLTFIIFLATVFILLFIPINPIWLILVGGVSSYFGVKLYSRIKKSQVLESGQDSDLEKSEKLFEHHSS